MFQIPYYRGSFNDNYIMFKNVEIFLKQIPTTKICEGKYFIFKNIIIFQRQNFQN
jgi:hypothetical protein